MINRAQQLASLDRQDEPWDLIVIGGGITGAGILREAVRLGYRVLLVEQKDFAWGTSSRSSKMVHGGLRYLGSGQLGLTRQAVRERERMLQELPGLVDNLYYLMPHFKRQFPGPRIFGVLLWLYDLISGRRTRRFYPVKDLLRWLPGLTQKDLVGGSRFSDAITDDSRLVMRLLHDCVLAGGYAVNYMAAKDVTPQPDGVTVTLEDPLDGSTRTLKARTVISATGAWTDRLREQLGGGRMIRPLRGSHLIVPFWRLPVAAAVSLFHPEDKRAMFVFPWEGVTVIGTTDLDHEQSLDNEAVIAGEELDYLLTAANYAFPEAHLASADIMSTWSGVRPVVSPNGGGNKAPSSETREHAVWDNQGVISVAGGKLTTFRVIAQETLAAAAPYLPKPPNPVKGDEPVFSQPPEPELDPSSDISADKRRRLQGRYGPELPHLLAAGPHTTIGTTGTLWAELIWSAGHESVQHLDDLLLRRTRLGLLLPEGGQAWLPDIRRYCQAALGWNDAQWQAEEARYRQVWESAYSLPAGATTATPGQDAPALAAVSKKDVQQV